MEVHNAGLVGTLEGYIRARLLRKKYQGIRRVNIIRLKDRQRGRHLL